MTELVENSCPSSAEAAEVKLFARRFVTNIIRINVWRARRLVLWLGLLAISSVKHNLTSYNIPQNHICHMAYRLLDRLVWIFSHLDCKHHTEERWTSFVLIRIWGIFRAASWIEVSRPRMWPESLSSQIIFVVLPGVGRRNIAALQSALALSVERQWTCILSNIFFMNGRLSEAERTAMWTNNWQMILKWWARSWWVCRLYSMGSCVVKTPCSSSSTINSSSSSVCSCSPLEDSDSWPWSGRAPLKGRTTGLSARGGSASDSEDSSSRVISERFLPLEPYRIFNEMEFHASGVLTHS